MTNVMFASMADELMKIALSFPDKSGVSPAFQGRFETGGVKAPPFKPAVVAGRSNLLGNAARSAPAAKPGMLKSLGSAAKKLFK